MAFSAMENTATISTTEYSLPNNSTTLTPQTDDCMLQAVIDTAAMTVTETYRIRIYDKVRAADAANRILAEAVLVGQQPQAYVFPAFILMNGWDVTVTKLAGADRAIGWSLRKVT